MIMLDNQTVEEFFLLLRHSLRGEALPQDYKRPSSGLVEYIDNEGLNWMFSGQGRDYPGISWDGSMQLRQGIYDRTMQKTLAAVTEAAREHGIPVAVLKGEILKDCYPDSILRISSDIDVFVPVSYRDDFHKLMESMSARRDEDITVGQIGVDDYIFQNGIHMETHYLFGINWTVAQREKMRSAGLFDEKNFVETEIRGHRYLTLEPTMHLTYMLYHFLKHMLFYESGLLRMLTDIALFVDRHFDEIDQLRLEQYLKELGYVKAADTVFAICKSRIGMNKDFRVNHRPTFEDKMLSRITAKETRLTSLFESLAWNIYKVRLITGADGYPDSELVFRPWAYVLSLPFALRWTKWRSFWEIGKYVRSEGDSRFCENDRNSGGEDDSQGSITVGLLKKGRRVSVIPKGSSMLPFLNGTTDSVIIRPPEDGEHFHKGELVLYTNAQGLLAVHRIWSPDSSMGRYVILGDGNTDKEYNISAESIHGIAESIEHEGRKISVSSAGFRLKSRIWRLLYPVRGRLISLMGKGHW